MVDFYSNVLAPKYLEAFASIGVTFIPLDGDIVRISLSVLELCAAFLSLINFRKLGALLAVLIIASGSKNITAKTINVLHFGDIEIYPIAVVQGIVAVLILILPGAGAKRKAGGKSIDNKKSK